MKFNFLYALFFIALIAKQGETMSIDSDPNSKVYTGYDEFSGSQFNAEKKKPNDLDISHKVLTGKDDYNTKSF